MSGKYERKDRLYQQAKSDGYRSRAAYKLIELNQKFRFLQAGAKVADLGSFPGGWLQVAQKSVGHSGLVLGVDLTKVEPVVVGKLQPVVLCGDARAPEIQDEILRIAGGRVDVLLSDMSPKLSGIRFRDSARSAELVDASLQIAGRILREGGTLIAKIFPGAECEELAPAFRQRFGKFTRECLKSSRKTSNEFYFVGRGFHYFSSDSSEARPEVESGIE